MGYFIGVSVASVLLDWQPVEVAWMDDREEVADFFVEEMRARGMPIPARPAPNADSSDDGEGAGDDDVYGDGAFGAAAAAAAAGSGAADGGWDSKEDGKMMDE